MRSIGLLAPKHRRCGIAQYAASLHAALRKRCAVRWYDPADDGFSVKKTAAALSGCAWVCVQYEPSLFGPIHRDFYSALCRRLPGRILTTVHEVYADHPAVFPRSSIRGRGPAGVLRRFVYDLRHPLSTMERRHRGCGYHADALMVHYPYQKELLVRAGVPAEVVHVYAHPVPFQSDGPDPFISSPSEPVRLGAAGFVNPSYDFDFLFAVLSALPFHWTFTWIGGPRTNEQEKLMQKVKQIVQRRGWTDRFTITGWVSSNVLRRRLEELHLYGAFFRWRSTSGTLAAALGAKNVVVATSNPLIDDHSRRHGGILCCEKEPAAAVRALQRCREEPSLRESLRAQAGEYARRFTYDSLAETLVTWCNEGEGR